MTKKHRHLLAAVGLSALAVLCFGLLTWALVEGAVVTNFPSDARIRGNTAGHQYIRPNRLYSRAENPGRYWLVVGLLGFFGTLFTTVAVLEYGSHRLALDTGSKTSSQSAIESRPARGSAEQAATTGGSA
ncbi:MAG: hypothetical protein AB1898_04550 [Acidobacteriota bacterium]